VWGIKGIVGGTSGESDPWTVELKCIGGKNGNRKTETWESSFKGRPALRRELKKQEGVIREEEGEVRY